MKKQIIIPTCLLISGLIISFPILADTFDGKNINVKWEAWDEIDSFGRKGDLLAVIDQADVVASDQTTPDITGFHSKVDLNGTKTTYELWDVEFIGESIDLTYTSRYVGDVKHQYMYAGPEGFRFEDTNDNLPDITAVAVDSSFAPFGFEPTLVTFDANNIYVNLNGSMCHIDGMASMPDCANSNSPTGFDNKIKLKVSFGEGNNNDFARIDALFNWAEKTYPEFFPEHVESMDVVGYHARHYPKSNVYLGTKDGHLFVYGDQFGGMLDAGELEQWFSTAGL